MIFNFINLVSFWHVTELSSTNNKWHVDSISLWLLILVIRKSSKHRRISGVKMFDELLRDENCQTAFLLANKSDRFLVNYLVLPKFSDSFKSKEIEFISAFCSSYERVVIGISSPRQDELALLLQDRQPNLDIYCLGAAIYNKPNRFIDKIGLNFLLFAVSNPKRFIKKITLTFYALFYSILNISEFKNRIYKFYDIY